ncbi:MAG: hypothetical protein AAGE84_29645 [Cyanobacteria bacterium P01_G01_bin.39]
MANKNTDFKLLLPRNAEAIKITDLSPEEIQCLEINSNENSNIYRYSVGIDYKLEPRKKVKSKYSWKRGVDCLYFATELRTEGYQFIRGIFPRRLETHSTDTQFEYSLEVGIENFAKAKIAGKIFRDNNRYNQIKLATRDDRHAFWVIDKKWIVKYGISSFQVVCVIPTEISSGKSYCKVCALRKNGEDILKKSGEVILA